MAFTEARAGGGRRAGGRGGRPGAYAGDGTGEGRRGRGGGGEGGRGGGEHRVLRALRGLKRRKTPDLNKREAVQERKSNDGALQPLWRDRFVPKQPPLPPLRLLERKRKTKGEGETTTTNKEVGPFY